MKMRPLNDLLAEYIANPENPAANLALGHAYKAIGQMAAATSFYLRAANLSEEPEFQYEAMLLLFFCISSLPSHFESLRTILYHCVKTLPQRPEAYFLLARHLEQANLFNDGYIWAGIGLMASDFSLKPLEGFEYPGRHGLEFEQAVCADRCDKPQEAEAGLLALAYSGPMDTLHRDAVLRNLKTARTHPNDWFTKWNSYRGQYLPSPKMTFPGAKDIERNYSESFQDLFVLTMLDGLRDSCYLEIGAGHPIETSNTYLLESAFGWTGVSIDINPDYAPLWREKRKSRLSCIDARDVNYRGLLGKLTPSSDFGYLQIDIDDINATFELLGLIPLKVYRFAVVTIEHDWCKNRDDRQKKAIRKYLADQGYVLAAADVSVIGTFAPFEDWFVHPDLVPSERYKDFPSALKGEGLDPRALFID